MITLLQTKTDCLDFQISQRNVAVIKISVIIATHNRQDQLLESLNYLYRQDFPADEFEILVSDDCSPQPVQVPRDAPVCTRLFRTAEKSGPGGARNIAAMDARGELIVFTDDDCWPEPDWLSEFWKAHQAYPGLILGGQLYNAVPEYIGAEASQAISDIVYKWYNIDPEDCRFFSTNNFAVPRSDFEALNRFHKAFRAASEDRDLCDRWLASGRKMRFVPSARVGHAHRLTVKKFFKQHVGYGRGAAVYHHERMLRGDGSVMDQMSFHGSLTSLIFQRIGKERFSKKVRLLFMMVLWQLANFVGYSYERYRLHKS